MKLFKKNKAIQSCCCGGDCTSETMQNAEHKKQEQGIKILGAGCAKCMKLEKAVRTAISEFPLDYEIEHITDYSVIASYGVMSTPALVLNGKVLSYGKVLSVDEVKALLR